jgi:hypothetical protein
MKHIRFIPCVALIGSMLISVPQGFAQNTAASNSSEHRSFDSRSQRVFADHHEDASASNLRSTPRRRQNR